MPVHLTRQQEKAMFAKKGSRRSSNPTSPTIVNNPKNNNPNNGGIFAKIKRIKAEHDVRVKQKLDASIKKEQAELDKLNKQLQEKALVQRVKLAKQKQVLDQRQQVESLKQEERKTRSELAKFTTTGKIKSLLKREASAVGAGAKRIAESPKTKAALKNIRKKIGL